MFSEQNYITINKGLIKISKKMSEWPYPYCPHRAYDKNLQLRLASIPYTFVPDPTIDAFTNVNVKCANLNKKNIQTLAYQNYMSSAPDTLPDTNFARDYYKEVKDLNAIKVDNNIVEQTKQQISKRNAYVLASEATAQYSKFEHDRKQTLENARRRATSTLRLHFQQKKDDKIQDNIQNSEWLKKLYRKLEQIAKHIVEGEGQSVQQKEKMFLLSKSSLTAGYLSKIKVKNPQTAFNILQELRTLMLKKKLRFQNQRQQQEKNKSVSMSYTTDTSQNTSQGSMLSEATSINESNIEGEQQIVARYCDFQALSKKWRINDIEQVKSMLRFLLTRKFVSQAEVNVIKKKRQAEKINQSIEKLNPQLSKKLKAEKQNKKQQQIEKRKRIQSSKTAKKPIQQKPLVKEAQLNKQDLAIKEKLLKGGQFDAVGQKFARNRNYSQLFAKKQKQILVEFQVKKHSQKQTPSHISNKQKMDSTLNL